MEAKDRNEADSNENGICRLEWIAWAMEAARRHKEEHSSPLRTQELEPSSEE